MACAPREHHHCCFTFLLRESAASSCWSAASIGGVSGWLPMHMPLVCRAGVSRETPAPQRRELGDCIVLPGHAYTRASVAVADEAASGYESETNHSDACSGLSSQSSILTTQVGACLCVRDILSGSCDILPSVNVFPSHC